MYLFWSSMDWTLFWTYFLYFLTERPTKDHFLWVNQKLFQFSNAKNGIWPFHSKLRRPSISHKLHLNVMESTPLWWLFAELPELLSSFLYWCVDGLTQCPGLWWGILQISRFNHQGHRCWHSRSAHLDWGHTRYMCVLHRFVWYITEYIPATQTYCLLNFLMTSIFAR